METENLYTDRQDIMKSPARRVLGDIKNVNESPPSPVSPTANLKLLTRVATHFMMRDFGDDEPSTDNLQVDRSHRDENTDSVGENRKKHSAGIKPRKEKSLSLLCDKFLELFPLDVPTDTNLFISLDQAAAQLHTERRRLYDIINVLESLQMASKIGKNSYQWYGNQQLLETLAVLKGLAEKLGYRGKVKAMQKLCSCSPRYRDKDLPLTSNNQQGDSGRDERSLGVLCQKFLMLFLVSDETDLVNLEVAARVVLAGCESEVTTDTEDIIPLHVGLGSTQLKAKARRLYDIANVLSSLKLIRKVHCQDFARKPAFTYCGPIVEPTNCTTIEETNLYFPPRSLYYPTRHSLLRPPYLAPAVEEKEKMQIGEGKRKLKRTYSDSELLPSNDCQEPQKTCVGDNCRDTECFGEAVVTVCLVDNTDTNISSASSVKTAQNADTCQKSTPLGSSGAADQCNPSTDSTETGSGMAVKRERVAQDHEHSSQTSNCARVGPELCGSKLIRHHSESCVGKTSLCVKRKLVKVAPLSSHKSSSMEQCSPEQVRNNHKQFVTAIQKPELVVQWNPCSAKPTTNIGDTAFMPYIAGTGNCASSLYLIDHPQVSTSDVCLTVKDSSTNNNKSEILSSPVISAVVMPAINQPRIILTEEMLKNGKRLTNYCNLPGQSTCSKRQLLPKGIHIDKQGVVQSPPVAVKKTDEIRLGARDNRAPYQQRWKSPHTKNSSHILVRNFHDSPNKNASVISQSKLINKCPSYSVVAGTDTNENCNLQLNSSLGKHESSQKKADIVGIAAVTQFGSDNKQSMVLTCSEDYGNCNTNQSVYYRQSLPHLPCVSKDHCYNRQQNGGSLQAKNCTSGIIGEEKIMLPHMVPGELYTAVKVGSVLQLVPVSSNSLLTKM